MKWRPLEHARVKAADAMRRSIPLRRFLTSVVAIAALGLAGASLAWAAPDANNISGSWRAEATVNGAHIPFRLDLTHRGRSVQARFFDGARPTNPSSAGDYRDGKLHLVFASYAGVLDATVTGNVLDGVYVTPGHSVPIHAVKGAPLSLARGPDIHGEWIIPYASSKGEAAWRLIVRQTGDATQATILRIDGDTGTLSGGFSDGVYRLSHFAGERPALLEATPQRDGSLKLALTDGSDHHDFIAVRPQVAAAKGLRTTDPRRHTRAAADAPFRFAFRDLHGRLVSNTDARFRGKVVLVNVMGSWCPNCHDEAPFLEAMYRKYAKAGLEVVGLDFEQPDQLANPTRLRAFIAQYAISYPVLIAGEPKEAVAKLPQASNLNAWPTTFFVGRDGVVHATHVGFTSPGSGRRDLETRADYERDIQRLLAQPAPKRAAG